MGIGDAVDEQFLGKGDSKKEKMKRGKLFLSPFSRLNEVANTSNTRAAPKLEGMKRAWQYGAVGILVFLLLAWWASPLVQATYTYQLYPAVTHLLVPVTSLVPFSLSAVLLPIVLVALLVGLVMSFKQSTRRAWLGRGLLVLLLGYGWFVLAWGGNYTREPVETLLSLPEQSVAETEVLELTHYFAEVVTENADSPRDVPQALASVRTSLLDELSRYGLTGVTLPPTVKTLPAGTLLTFGYAGVISPFTLEAHVDGGVTDTTKVSVGAHELAHVAGFAGEADTYLVSTLAGLKADNGFARYAIALGMFDRASAQLPAETRQALIDTLPATAQADYQAIQDAKVRYYRPALARPLSGLYDAYLRSQGVSAGVGDYGRVIKLLVHAREKGLLR